MDYNPGSLDITLWDAIEPGIIPNIAAIIIFFVLPIVIIYLIKKYKKQYNKAR